MVHALAGWKTMGSIETMKEWALGSATYFYLPALMKYLLELDADRLDFIVP